jgi:hypothetical protein
MHLRWLGGWMAIAKNAAISVCSAVLQMALSLNVPAIVHEVLRCRVNCLIRYTRFHGIALGHHFSQVRVYNTKPNLFKPS